MSTTVTDVLVHMLQTIEAQQSTITGLKSKSFSLRRLKTLLPSTLQTYVDAGLVDPVDQDLIVMLQKWFNQWANNNNPTDYDELIKSFTETEWDNFLILQKPLSTSQAALGTASSPIVITDNDATIKVSLKDYPTTTGKSEEWLAFRRVFMTVAGSAGLDDLLLPSFIVPDKQKEPKAYSKFAKLNKQLFYALDYSLVKSSLNHFMDKHRATHDGRAAFMEIDLYQKGHGSEDVYASFLLQQLQSLKLTPTFSEGAEGFCQPMGLHY